MLFDSQLVSAQAFAARSGWHLRPEGLCREDVCVPLPPAAVRDGELDLVPAAEALRMPLVHDNDLGVWALGPPAGAPVLASAHAPDLRLPDVQGQPFELDSLRGKKVLILAWASW